MGNNLQDSLTSLESAVERLEERIVNVLSSPPRPETGKDSEVGETEVGARFGHASTRVENLKDKVEWIIERVEL